MTTSHHERMSSVDTAWLRMDDAGGAMMIVGVSATETPIRPDDFRRMIRQRLLCFERFRHRPVADALGASWVEDDSFDLDAHLEFVTLPPPAGKTELEALAAELASTTLDPRRPMWQFHFVRRYCGGSAWVMRMHHCYADGVALMHVLMSMTEPEPTPASGPRTPPLHAAAARRAYLDVLPVLNRVERLTQPAGNILENALVEGAKLLEAGIRQLFHPERAATTAAQAGGMVGELAKVLALPDDPDTPLRGNLSGRKAVAWGAPIPLHEVRTVGRALGCTVNDVLMSTVAGALGGYLRARGFDTDDLTVRASVPVNLRTTDEPLTLGNRFGLVFVELAPGLANPLTRLFATSDTMAAIKGSLQPATSLLSLGLMGVMPAVVQAPLMELFSRKATAVVSNVPGPQAPRFVCGQRITEMYFWVPQSGSMGLGFSLLSYAGQVYFGTISDRQLVDDPQALVARFAAEFEKLLLAATVGALGAREKMAPRRGRPPARRRRRTAATT
jgi:WS/DGAT/MGAT family acyltransferase